MPGSTGYVASWVVDIGDHVHSGQIMASIDTPELDAQLAAARAQLKTAQAQVEVRKAEAVFAKTTYERWRDSPDGVVSAQEREEKQAAFGTANAQLPECLCAGDPGSGARGPVRRAVCL